MPSRPTQNFLQTPGDVNITDLRLQSFNGAVIDLMGLFNEISIYEDLFSNTISGHITITDTYNLIQHFPIMGNERLYLSFSTPGMVFEGNNHLVLSVYSISDRILGQNNNYQTYTLHFTTPEYLSNINTRISKSYNGRIEQIVSDIYDSKIAQTEQNNNFPELANSDSYTIKRPLNISVSGVKPIRCIIPKWTPYKAINWLSEQFISSLTPNDCSCLFYQTIDGFHLTTLGKLYGQESVQEYVYVESRKRLDDDRMDLDTAFRNVEEYNILDIHNRIDQVRGGMYASKLLTHDIVTKEYSESKYNYKTDFFGLPNHVESYPLIADSKFEKYSEQSDAAIQFKPKHTNMYDDVDDNDNVEKRSLKRASLLKQIQSTKINIVVPGDSRIRVGNIVNFSVPSPETRVLKEQLMDTYLTGRYLVTAVRHRISHDDYKLLIELSRESVPIEYPGIKEFIV